MDSKATRASFLTTPPLLSKPRTVGLTHVLDKGNPLASLSGILDSCATFVDIWKFGWGTSYLDSELDGKLRLLETHNIRTCTGGTLLEVAWIQKRTGEFFDWAESVGLQCIEASNGATGLPLEAKRDLLFEARERGFNVLTEVGSKDPDDHATPQQWVDEIAGDLAAGATWVVTEGRESGTVGLYTSDGEVRVELVEAIEAAVSGSQIIYEAPRRNQQAWLIRTLGPEVNLGNVDPAEVMSVQSLRMGLRSDTIGLTSAKIDRYGTLK